MSLCPSVCRPSLSVCLSVSSLWRSFETCYPSCFAIAAMMKSHPARSLPKLDNPFLHVLVALDDLADNCSLDSTTSPSSLDHFFSDFLPDDSPPDPIWDGNESTGTSTSTSVHSSPLRRPRVARDLSRFGKQLSLPTIINNRETLEWEENTQKKADDEPKLSELELVKDRFAKLLLGEDLNGGGKGVSSALAISNAITNLSASVFGELWRLEPLAEERKSRWRREMGWLLSVSDYIVEFVPSSQPLPDGRAMEVMVTKPRPDLHINLPALRKLDTMLLDALDSFSRTEFEYTSSGEKDGSLLHRQEEKWWLPTPIVPSEGLSVEARKHLQHQKECVNQILKAALAINAHVLSEMEVPAVYWDALPKNGRSSLGEALYRAINSESFSPEVLISSIDPTPTREHNILELVNRVEAAIHIWRRKLQIKQLQMQSKEGGAGSKTSWGLSKDGVVDLEKRELLAEKAESLFLLLRQRFPGLRQTILDMNKIQYNKDVGQSILESYSRVLESLAFSIKSRIDDVVYADDLIKKNLSPNMLIHTPTNRGGFLALPVQRPSGISVQPPNSSLPKPRIANEGVAASPALKPLPNKTLSEFIGWNVKADGAQTKQQIAISKKATLRINSKKYRSYSGKIHAMRSPPSRD